MSKREIASLVIKLMGVFILFKSIAYVPMIISSISTAVEALSSHSEFGLLAVFGVVFLSVLLSAIPLVWSMLVILLSDKVAKWLIKDDQDVQISDSINRDDIMTVAISCIGLYFIIAAVPVLINGIWSNSMMRIGMPEVRPSAVFALFKAIIAPAAQV